MKKNIFTRIALVAWTFMAGAGILLAQDNQGSSSTLTRRSGNERKRSTEVTGPQITDRMQSFYDESGNNLTDADRQWMRVIYRELDLDNDKNAVLYFPEDNIEGQESLFRIIMRLLANGQIKAYEYLDGREVFNEENQLDVRNMLERYDIIYSEAKGSTAKAPRFEIHPSDVPTTEILSYYIIEQWEFDTRSNKTKAVVQAIAPILHRIGDFGEGATRYPMFWIKYSDLRPWLAQQSIFLDDDNNLPTATYDDFFTLNLYDGDIYKTRNLKNKTMVQLYPDPEERKAAQDSIQNRLTSYDKNIWVPDREDIIAANNKSHKSKKENVEEDNSDNESVNSEADDQKEEKEVKRTTKRTTKKAKTPKVKETKVKSSSSSNATRSVRKRK